MRDIDVIKSDIEKSCDKCKFNNMRDSSSRHCMKCHDDYSEFEVSDLDLFKHIAHDIPLDKLSQICEAERDGRNFVLPCKVGDTVYIITTCDTVTMYCDNDYETGTGAVECPFYDSCNFNECDDNNRRIFETAVTSYWIEEDGMVAVFFEDISCQSYVSDFGKTVFLTKEQAEQVLNEMEEKPNE
jgi:hypothetical protein